METHLSYRRLSRSLLVLGSFVALVAIAQTIGAASPQQCAAVMPYEDCIAPVCCDASYQHCAIRGYEDFGSGYGFSEIWVCSETTGAGGSLYRSPTDQWLLNNISMQLGGWIIDLGDGTFRSVNPMIGVPWDIKERLALPEPPDDFRAWWPNGTGGESNMAGELHAIRFELMQMEKLMVLIAGLLAGKAATDQVHP